MPSNRNPTSTGRPSSTSPAISRPTSRPSFELLLAGDQEAREAVAGALELAGALAFVGPEFAPRRRSKVRRVFVGATALAAAAGLLVAIPSAFRSIVPGQPNASEVALAWSGLRRASTPIGCPSSPDPNPPDGPDPTSPTKTKRTSSFRPSEPCRPGCSRPRRPPPTTPHWRRTDPCEPDSRS